MELVDIRCKRVNLGYTQKDIAEKCHVSRSHYNCVECGKRAPSAELLLRICDALHIPQAEALHYIGSI